MFFVQTLIDKIFALRYNKYTNYIIRRFSAMFIRPEIEFVEVIDIITTSATSGTTASKPGIETPPDEF